MEGPPAEVELVPGGRKLWRSMLDGLGAVANERRFVCLALLAILLLGASMRLTGVNWDEGTHLHPDERFLTDVTSRLAWPESVQEYFDEARSPLNPRNRGYGMFVYGTLPVFIVKRLAILLNQDSYSQIHLVGRVVSASYDLAVVLLVYFIGRRLYGRWVGLLASFLMACTVLNIQHSHFYTVETFTTLLVTLAFFFTIRVVQGGGWADWALTGATFGMAVAGKISVATYLMVIGAAGLMRALREGAAAQGRGPSVFWEHTLGRLSIRMQLEGENGRSAERVALLRGLVRAGLGLGLALLCALIAFRVTQPYAFTGPSPFSLRLSLRWLEDMSIASRLVSGAIDFPPSHQWADREPIWFGWRNMVVWGMGLPLGLAAWLGWLVATVELVRKHKLEHLLLLVWVTFTFVYHGLQFVQSIRYFLPIYPLLVILAAYFVVWLWRQAQALAANQGRRWAPAAAAATGAAVIVGTFLYAQAFTNIYRRPLTRVAASRWVYSNIPPGASLTWERWDDIIPQNVDGKDASRTYNLIATDPYWEDTPEKREAMLQWLDEADYVIFSSNRCYDSIPRLPERFPLTTAYYEYLFSGELGFEVIKVFTSYPNLGPIQFVDDDADEAFTVYDHPKVTILQKTPAYSSARARELLGDIPVDRLMRMSALEATRSRHGMMLRPEERLVQQQGGTWSAIFDRDSLANQLPVLAWLAVIEILALAALPLAFVAFPRFRDRGFVFAKVLGILLASYLAWLGPSLRIVPYTRLTIAGVTLLLLGLAAGLAWRLRRQMLDFARREWRYLLFEQGLYLAFFTAFLLVRLGNPDLWHPVMGGEKPMNLAYLNAIIRSTWFPPYDPWFAGGYINYYYFGHLIVATLCKLSGIVPTVAYNLALSTLSALTAMGAYAVVSGLLGRDRRAATPAVLDQAARFGLFGALLVAVLGNLGQVRLLLNGFRQASQLEFRSTIPALDGLVEGLAGFLQVALGGRSLSFRPEWWYWNASRVMGAGEINEFPYFTFLYGDLHAHQIALPFTLLALGLTVSLLRGRGQAEAETRPLAQSARAAPDSQPPAPAGLRARLSAWAGRVDWADWLALGLLALTLGELRVNNTWDYPTYLLVALGGLLFARVLRPEGVAWGQVWPVAARFLLLVIASTLLFQPFHARYGAAYTSVELWRGPRTAPGDYLVIHGLFLFILVSYLFSRAFGYQARGALARSVRLSLGQPFRLGRYNRLTGVLVEPSAGFQLGWLGIVALLVASLASILALGWLVGLALPLLFVALWLVVRRDLAVAERFAALLFAGGLLLTVVVEVLVLRGDIGRMNTVFKLYLQVWVLWGVAATVALAQLSRRWARWPTSRRTTWQVGLGLLLFGAALYPLTATYGKINDRFDRRVGPTLDGAAFAQMAVYYDRDRPLHLRHDMEAIRWLQDNVEGSPVILEANTPLYRWGSRVSIYTGLPTVIGWDWHQKQQRALVSNPVVDWRLDDVRRLYDGTDDEEMVRLLKLYDVSYVYVGELEQAYYSSDGLAKFDRLTGRFFDVVYRQGPVTIYRVRKESLGGLSTRPFPETRPSLRVTPFVVTASSRSERGPFVVTASSRSERERRESSLQGEERLKSSLQGEGRESSLQRVGGGKSLLLGEPVDLLPVVDDRGWNRLANAGPLPAILAWWLAFSLIGWAAWPLCLGVCRALPDRGYLLSKAAGWLAVGYGLWAGASTRLVANRVPAAYAMLVLLLLAGIWAAWRQRSALVALWRTRRGLLLRQELLFSGAFLALVLIRLLNPDLWQPWFGGEKMMEVAYLNAILKSAHFPPYDPYFAGGYINYYYYGFYLVNVLVKLTGIVPEVAFNLAVPTFFALTVGQAFSFGHALTARLRGRRWLWGGLAAAVGVALLANLTVLVQWLAGLVALGGGVPEPESGLEALRPLLLGLARWPAGQGELPPFDYWYQATRIIPFTINEFPFFSFLFADLHPHMMSLPFTIATLVLCLSFRRKSSIWGFLLLALTAGALGPLNMWDLPTYLGLALLIVGWVAVERRHGWWGLAQIVAVVALAYLLYLPFYRHYAAPPLALRFLPNRTGLRYFLVVWGLWLAALYSWLLMRWWRGEDGGRRALASLLARRGAPPEWRATPLACVRWLVVAVALLLSGVALASGQSVVALLLPLAALGFDLWVRPCARPAERLAGLLAVAGCLVLAGTELFYLVDFLQGTEWYRMNTVFKFGIQAWVLLALAAAAGLPEALAWLRGGGGAGRRAAWAASMLALVGISLAYLPLGVTARVNERFPGGAPPVGTLDGLAYMQNGVYYWPDEDHPVVLRYDYEAIHWLIEHVRGTPVVAEAPLGYYREGGMRVSSYTGLPTLLGAHQIEQRPAGMVGERGRLAEALFRAPDPEMTLDLLRRLRVQYIYWGQLEEIVYGLPAKARFDALVAHGALEVVFTNPKVTIYRFDLD